MRKIFLLAIPSILLLGCNGNQSNSETAKSESSANETKFQPANINEHVIYNRAFEAVVWGMPAVNSEVMYESVVKAKGGYNQIAYWPGLINAKNQMLTPNPDVIYITPFHDTRQGPVVLEIPPVEGVSSLTGSVDDAWQTAIEDVGPAGVDKGKGGKYLILPPGYKDKIPVGYIPMPSPVYTGFSLLRSNLTDGSEQDIARAVAYAKKVKIYPYSQASNPPPTTFVDILQTPFSGIIPYDLHFFESLNNFVQREPWLIRDMVMVDKLKTIGIEKDKTFSPDARTKEILLAAIKDAHIWIDEQYQAAFKPPFYDGTHWALPAESKTLTAIMANYTDAGNYPVDGKAVLYSMAFFSAKHLGTGQYYLVNLWDKNGDPLEGSKTYRLNLPANVPVKLYWSMTIYDRETHGLVKGMSSFSKASTSPGIQKNADGSTDVYFGPKAPNGKEANWIPTDPNRKVEILARFYGPEKGFFAKTWKMGDVEEVK